jgi:uncharacterized protein YuzE
MQEVTYSPRSDAMYIYFNKGLPWGRNEKLDFRRIIDWSKDGRLIGIELLDVRRLGVDVTGLPERETVERVLADREIKILQEEPLV